MPQKIVLLTIPGLRESDIAQMPNVQRLVNYGQSNGQSARIQHSFPAVTWPTQTNVLTGVSNAEHGIVANGIYDRDKHHVEMWTSWNEVIEAQQIWDAIRNSGSGATSAAWFPMLSKGCNADFVCMPAPIHKPDGSEDLWCHTKPQEYYGEMLEQFGHFPLKHFWGPLANIKSSEWIANTAVATAKKFNPDFFYIYLPHLDYAAQKDGPDSPTALNSVLELDQVIGSMADSMSETMDDIIWMIVSEYVITEVNHVSFPNRILRDAGLLKIRFENELEQLDFENSDAWAMVDHQFSHIFVKDSTAETIQRVTDLFANAEGIFNVVSGEARTSIGMNHERAGDVILVSNANSWQAYYWWNDDALAPEYARTVDIHRKPGYDPVELHFDFSTMTVPLDASLIKGSHGAPVESDAQKGVFLTSSADLLHSPEIRDRDIFDLVMKHYR